MPISVDTFQWVRDMVRRRAAIVLEDGKEYLVESRLGPLARNRSCPSIDAMVASMRTRQDPVLEREVIEAMTTNETSWFRDMHPFEALKAHVLPDVVARRQAERRIRIWCAACSSGQEPYTIAMTIREHFPSLRDWEITILGTDISRDMVARSARGQYGQIEMNRGLPASLLIKYFDKAGMHWQVKTVLSSMCEFRELNLIERWGPLPEMDIIFLRNVLIYFDVATKKQIISGMARILPPWGYLFLGGAETTLNLDVGFERVQLDRAGCYRPTAAGGRLAVSRR